MGLLAGLVVVVVQSLPGDEAVEYALINPWIGTDAQSLVEGGGKVGSDRPVERCGDVAVGCSIILRIGLLDLVRHGDDEPFRVCTIAGSLG